METFPFPDNVILTFIQLRMNTLTPTELTFTQPHSHSNLHPINFTPVVPNKAVAEVSNIGNL